MDSETQEKLNKISFNLGSFSIQIIVLILLSWLSSYCWNLSFATLFDLPEITTIQFVCIKWLIYFIFNRK
jgi:hypothetical protein